MPPVGTIPRLRRCFLRRTARTPLVFGLRFISLRVSQGWLQDQLIAPLQKERGRIRECLGLRRSAGFQTVLTCPQIAGAAKPPVHSKPVWKPALVCPAGAGSLGMEVPDGADDGNRSQTARGEP
jgi:hypothetical protein